MESSNTPLWLLYQILDVALLVVTLALIVFTSQHLNFAPCMLLLVVGAAQESIRLCGLVTQVGREWLGPITVNTAGFATPGIFSGQHLYITAVLNTLLSTISHGDKWCYCLHVPYCE